MTVTEDTILEVVRTAVAEAMFVDKDEVQPTTTIFGDLGAESIDLLDIMFRVERQTGVKLEIEDLTRYIQGDLKDEEFWNGQGRVTPAGLAHLKSAIPGFKLDALGDDVTPETLFAQITVQYVADRVTDLAERKSATAS
jgi:acyl carrier protein